MRKQKVAKEAKRKNTKVEKKLKTGPDKSPKESIKYRMEENANLELCLYLA